MYFIKCIFLYVFYYMYFIICILFYYVHQLDSGVYAVVAGRHSHVVGTWLMHGWRDSFTCVTCVTWLIDMCDMTLSHVWHDSFIRVTWRIHTRDMTHSNVWRDSFVCVTRLIHPTYTRVCSVGRGCESCHTHEYEWHMSHMWISQSCHRYKHECVFMPPI